MKQQFVRLSKEYLESEFPYIATQGMNDAVILPAKQVLYPGGVFIEAEAMRPYMLEKNHHLCGSIGEYFFDEKSIELVANPFAHWNRLKSVGMHA